MLASTMAFLSEYAGWLVAVSIGTLVVAGMLVPVFIRQIPVDYFSCPRRHPRVSVRHPLIYLLLAAAKNLLGAILVLAGLLMLFTPGQGLLFLLSGLMIMNYPGKFQIERWLIQRPFVLPAVNRLRERYGCPPLNAPTKREKKT